MLSVPFLGQRSEQYSKLNSECNRFFKKSFGAQNHPQAVREGKRPREPKPLREMGSRGRSPFRTA